MDPNLFHLDWERTFEVLAGIIVLAFLIERALAPIFEHRWFIENFDGRGIKEFIAIAVSITVCVIWKFDALSIVILAEQTSIPGYVITGAIVAGGSKASVTLFHNLLNVRSTAHQARFELRASKAAQTAEEAAKQAEEASTLEAASRSATVAKKARADAARAAQISGSPVTKAFLLRAEAAAAKAEVEAEKKSPDPKRRGPSP